MAARDAAHVGSLDRLGRINGEMGGPLMSVSRDILSASYEFG